MREREYYGSGSMWCWCVTDRCLWVGGVGGNPPPPPSRSEADRNEPNFACGTYRVTRENYPTDRHRVVLLVLRQIEDQPLCRLVVLERDAIPRLYRHAELSEHLSTRELSTAASPTRL